MNPIYVLIIIFLAFNEYAYSESIFDNLISHWTLDSKHIKEKRIIDNWSKNHGDIKGDPKIQQGIINESLHFDGIDDHIVVGEVTEGYDLTYAIWINPDEIPKNNSGSVILWDNKSPANDSYIVLMPDSKIWVRRQGDGFGRLISKNIIHPEKWTYIAFVADSIEQKKYLYINGSLDSVSDGIIRDRTNDSHVVIGWVQSFAGIPAHPFYRNSNFSGKLDEIWIYSKALSEREIFEHYKTTVDIRPIQNAISTWSELKH